MAYRFFCLVGLFLFMPALIPPPAEAIEIYRDWQRSRRRRQADQQWERINQPATIQQGNEEGVQEIHGAVDRRDCYKMAKKFQNQGRRVKLVRVEETRNPGAVLRFQCIFQGEDAQTGWYDERRY